jgi:hypothetical protein
LNKQTDESEDPTEHTEHIFNKGECECGEIDLTYNTEGLTFEKIGGGDTAYYAVTSYTGSDKKVYISDTYDGLKVKEIADYAFQGQLNRVSKVNIPNSIEKIGKEAFDSCTSLTEIIIPENVKTIEDEAISTPKDKYVSVIIKGNKTAMERYSVKAPNSGTKIGAGIYFLNGEPDFDKQRSFGSGPVSLYYLAGTEDKWGFDDNGLWGKNTVTKFYGFGVEDTTDHSNHSTEIKSKLDCTCTDYGFTGNKFCADCNVVYEVGVMTAPCHNYTSTVIPPTCTEDGYTTYTCECGDTYILNSEATGHSVNDDGVCDACGELIEEPTVLDRIIKILENIFASVLRFFINILNFMYDVFGNIL